jgi:hypothetical protein
MALPAFAAPLIGGVLGGLGGKERSQNPPMERFSQTSQMTPWDFNPQMGGNQGADILGSILGAYGGLLGHSMNQFQQRPQGNQLQDMLNTFNQEFYNRRDNVL